MFWAVSAISATQTGELYAARPRKKVAGPAGSDLHWASTPRTQAIFAACFSFEDCLCKNPNMAGKSVSSACWESGEPNCLRSACIILACRI